MEGEIMVGHDEFQYNAIPKGKEFPLWQGKQNKAWEPVCRVRVYISPNGQSQDTVGIFCTAVKRNRERYVKGRKFKTRDEVQTWVEARDARDARRAAAAVPADWEARIAGMDEGCAPEREPKRRRSDKLELGHRLTYNSDDPAYDSNEDDPAYDSNDENPGTGGPVSRKYYTYNQHGQRST